MNKVEERQLGELYRDSQVEYAKLYLTLFSAYNLWFRVTTGEAIDSKAIKLLHQHDDMWLESELGETLPQLRSLMVKLYVLTNHRPLEDSSRIWKGYLDDQNDWRGLIDFWYAVRCDLIHASTSRQLSFYPLFIKLAYESLNVFMTEVVKRVRLSIDETDLSQLELDQISSSMMRQYLLSPEKNRVDTVSAKRFDELYRLQRKNQAFLTDRPFTS